MTLIEIKAEHKKDVDAAAIHSDIVIDRMINQQAELIRLLEACIPYIQDMVDSYSRTAANYHNLTRYEAARSLLESLSEKAND